MIRLLDDGVETDAVDADGFRGEWVSKLIEVVRGGATLDQLCIWNDCQVDIWAHLSGYKVPSIVHLEDGFISANGFGGFKIDSAIQ